MTAYEVGGKFEGYLGSAPVRFTIAAFNQNVKDVQRSQYATPPRGQLSGFTANIPKSRIRGVEVEGFVSPASWLQIGANAAFLDPKFTSSTAVLFGATKNFGPYPDTPKFTGSIFSEVNVPLANDFANLSLRGEVYHQSETFYSSLNDTFVPGTRIAPYTVANFRVSRLASRMPSSSRGSSSGSGKRRSIHSIICATVRVKPTTPSIAKAA